MDPPFLPFNPFIIDTNEKKSFKGLELLLEAVPYQKLQTILVTYVRMIIQGCSVPPTALPFW